MNHSIKLLNSRSEVMHRVHCINASSTHVDFKMLHYQRPTTANNFGCGKGAFVSHDDIEKGGFIYKDAIYLMCEVN